MQTYVKNTEQYIAFSTNQMDRPDMILWLKKCIYLTSLQTAEFGLLIIRFLTESSVDTECPSSQKAEQWL